MSIPSTKTSTTSLAETLAEHLNEQRFSMAFDAKYRMYPDDKTTEISDTQVNVYDGPRSSEPITRASYRYIDTVFIVIQRKIEPRQADAITKKRELEGLLREFESYFEGNENALEPRWRFVGYDESTERTPFSNDTMMNTGVFSTVVALQFWSLEEN